MFLGTKKPDDPLLLRSGFHWWKVRSLESCDPTSPLLAHLKEKSGGADCTGWTRFHTWCSLPSAYSYSTQGKSRICVAKILLAFYRRGGFYLLPNMNYWLPDTEMFCLCSVLPLHDYPTIKEIITMCILANHKKKKKMGFNGKFGLFKLFPSLQTQSKAWL